MTFSIVTSKVVTDNTGASISIPILMTPEGPIRSLIDYALSVRRSLSWQEKLLRAVKLFLEYLVANTDTPEEKWRIFRNFSSALRLGTIDPITKEDPSCLFWPSHKIEEVNLIIRQLSEFFDWLGHKDRESNLNFNPEYLGTRYDQRVVEQAYQFRRNKAFLGHGWSNNPKYNRGKLIRGERAPKVFQSRPPMFPEDNFEELLFKGFKVAGKYDYRGMLISLMLYGGGLRVCEPFHLYMADVQPHWDNPDVAFLTIHHPSLGSAPNHWKNHLGQRGSRQEYLANQFGMAPRHVIRGKIHAGWKHPALDGRWYMQVYWLPEIYGEWFLQIWQRYMEQVASIERNHPFAWINIGRDAGGIYTISKYQKALENAVERIGLVFGKTYGTTAHGSRHAYAQRARRGGIDPIIIQRIMHHCSPDSQLVYTQPEIHEAIAAIQNGAQRLRDQFSTTPNPMGLLNELSL